MVRVYETQEQNKFNQFNYKSTREIKQNNSMSKVEFMRVSLSNWESPVSEIEYKEMRVSYWVSEWDWVEIWNLEKIGWRNSRSIVETRDVKAVRKMSNIGLRNGRLEISYPWAL